MSSGDAGRLRCAAGDAAAGLLRCCGVCDSRLLRLPPGVVPGVLLPARGIAALGLLAAAAAAAAETPPELAVPLESGA